MRNVVSEPESGASSSSRAFLRNCWQVAAFAHELDAPFLARRFLNERVVMFRTADKTIVALEDRCPHRLVPLSLGKRCGDAIQCGYHGAVVSADGSCASVPGQRHVPKGSSTRTYPVAERYGLVWIWMGVSDLADAGLIPDVRWLDHPGWTTAKGYLHFDADYRLLNDNLLDLSHETYIHQSSIGNREEESIADFPATVTTQARQRVFARREMPNIEPPPAWDHGLHLDGRRIDRLQVASYMPPGLNMTEAGYKFAGEPGDYHSFHARIIHFLTPESGRSTHYFYTLTRNYDLDNEAFTRAMAEGTYKTFTEDKFMVEWQQRVLLERDDDRVPNMPIALDGAAIQGRRILDAMIRREREDPRAVVPPLDLVADLDRIGVVPFEEERAS
jgi:vanillate O-demethylase monooxygenase subunit